MEGFTISGLSLNIGYDGGNPNSVEAHVLDVVKLVDHALPCATTVDSVTRVTSRAGAIGGSKTVDDELVDGSATPVIRRSGQRRNGQERKYENASQHSCRNKLKDEGESESREETSESVGGQL